MAQAATKVIISNRQRQRRYRQRQRYPVRMVFRVEVERDKLLNKLIDAGLVSVDQCWRRDLVETVLSRIIDDFVRRRAP
jgi:hypothetical protein